MNFTQAILSGFNKYVTFAGRATRSEYWYWALFSFLVHAVGRAVDHGPGIGIAGGIVTLAIGLPSIAVGVRRLHDIDRTGWWLLISPTIIGLVVLLVWFCFKGTDGANRFGADPLA